MALKIKDPYRSIPGLKSRLSKIRFSVAHDVANRAAPEMTQLSKSALSSGKTVYGESRPRGVDGNRLTLHRTGRFERFLAFTATGRNIRAILPDYGKYLIGKYDALPNGPLPAKWKDRLKAIVAETKVKL